MNSISSIINFLLFTTLRDDNRIPAVGQNGHPFGQPAHNFYDTHGLELFLHVGSGKPRKVTERLPQTKICLNRTAGEIFDLFFFVSQTRRIFSSSFQKLHS